MSHARATLFQFPKPAVLFSVMAMREAEMCLGKAVFQDLCL
jgi:hypothetical protein